jgi:hypothetical protein
MTHPSEDPAVLMARRALYCNNPVYHQPYYNEDLKYIPTVLCFLCGNQTRSKGCHLKIIGGKKRHICPTCYEITYEDEE